MKNSFEFCSKTRNWTSYSSCDIDSKFNWILGENYRCTFSCTTGNIWEKANILRYTKCIMPILNVLVSILNPSEN